MQCVEGWSITWCTLLRCLAGALQSYALKWEAGQSHQWFDPPNIDDGTHFGNHDADQEFEVDLYVNIECSIDFCADSADFLSNLASRSHYNFDNNSAFIFALLCRIGSQSERLLTLS